MPLDFAYFWEQLHDTVLLILKSEKRTDILIQFGMRNANQEILPPKVQIKQIGL